MMKTVYVSKKTGEVYDIVSTDEKNAVLSLNGEEKVVALSTLKRWYVSGNVETEDAFGIEEIIATEPETTAKEENISKVSTMTEMIETILKNTGVTYNIEDKTLIVSNSNILKILKDGVAIKEKFAKESNIPYEKKGYNHAFKAKVVVGDAQYMQGLLKCLLEKGGQNANINNN